jgi:hypothetical protein
MMEAANIQTKHIVKVLTGLLKAARPQTIVASFRNAGIAMIAEELQGGQRCLICKIQPELARALQVDIQAWATREMPEGDVLDDDPQAADDKIEMALYLEEFAELIGAVGRADYALKPDDVPPDP